MTAVPARKYNPGFLSDDELIASFCVRTHEFESLVEALRGCTGDSNQHQIVIGPRGSGKTSLLLRVAAEVRRDADLAAGFFPIVFAEESYEVGTAGEFWLECLARLAIQAPEREDAPDLHATLADLRTIHDDQTLGERCLATLLDFADREGKRLVLIVENLNMMFRDMMDRDAGWRLRKILQTEPRIVLLASATSRFNEIDRPDRAMYDQFRELTLRPLTTAECTVLWETVAGPSRPTNTIRSLEILTGGSPRLLAIVARFGAGLSFRELMDSLFDLVDDHTEYFKSHLESLPAQERGVYLALADLWKPALTKEVAERARLETSKCSAQLARLMERGVVRLDGGTVRRKRYYLSERMYNIYYLLRRGKDRLVEVLIRFMAAYYSPAEIKDIIAREEGAVPEYALKLLERWECLPEGGDGASDESSDDDPELVAARALFEQGEEIWERGRSEDALATIDELLRRFGATQKPKLLAGVASALINKGHMLRELGRPEEALATYDEVSRRFGQSETPGFLRAVASALFQKGGALSELDRSDSALAIYDEILRRFGQSETPDLLELVAKTLVCKGWMLGTQNRPEEALAAYDETLRRFGESEKPEILEPAMRALVNKGFTLGTLNRREEEVGAYDSVLRRLGESKEPAFFDLLAETLSCKGEALRELNRLDEALETHDELLLRFGQSETSEFLEPVARALVNKGATLDEMKRFEEALAPCDEVVRRFGRGGTPALSEQVANALDIKTAVQANLNHPAQRSDVAVLMAILPELDSPFRTIRALLKFSIDLGPERMLEFVQASAAADLLQPLTTALEREMGLDPRVPEEVSEVAEDIRRYLGKAEKAPPMRNGARRAKLRSQREPPLYFAGRAKELAALNRRLDDLRETGDPTGGMALIVGVPGAGKTQLGRRFAEDAAAHGESNVRHLAVDTTMLENDVDLFMAIARALGAEAEGRRVADLDTRSTGHNAGIGIVRGGVTQEHVRHTGSLSALLNASHHAGMWQRKALVLVVDELQTIEPRGMRALRVLHQGDHGCPILLLGIGLQHMQQVLGNPPDGSAGISRIAEPMALAPLSEKEALEAVNRNMVAMGYEIPETSASALAEASQGFPQHIHGYLRGAVEAIDEHGSLEPGPSLYAALKAGAQARTNYYDTRLSMLADQDAMLPVIETMLATGRTSLRRAEAVEVVNKAAFDGENTVRQAIAHGVLTLDRGGVSFGIPSFHRHMERLLEEHRQLQKRLREQDD